MGVITKGIDCSNMYMDLSQKQDGQNSISDIEKTVMASTMFDNVIEYVRNSKLNFQLQLSPFSAHISLRRSLIKNRSGDTELPPLNLCSTTIKKCSQQNDKNAALEIEVNTLKDANKKLTEELKAANLRIHSLEIRITAIDVRGIVLKGCLFSRQTFHSCNLSHLPS